MTKNENVVFSDRLVSVKWSTYKKQHYIDLGYKFTKIGDAFDVAVDHLTKGSQSMVWVICPDCKCERQMRYDSIGSSQSTVCQPCSRLRRSADLTGRRFGRFSVIKRLGKYSDGCYMWECRCDCGEVRHVPTSNLTRGLLLSCGCLHRERISGENHYKYNYSLTDEDRLVNRDDPESSKWKVEVKRLAGFKCEACGDAQGGNLVSHHLDSWGTFVNARYDLTNGACLCEDCHKEFHGNYGYGGNTIGQFVEWLLAYGYSTERYKQIHAETD